MTRLSQRVVQVNGTRRNLPVVIENKIKVQISGRYVLLETDFGLWVRFDGNHYVEVSVSGCYKGQLCGLCGEYPCSSVPSSHTIRSFSVNHAVWGLVGFFCPVFCLSQSNLVCLVWTAMSGTGLKEPSLSGYLANVTYKKSGYPGVNWGVRNDNCRCHF